MAEIEIQRKKRPVWPWILGAIAAILLLWLVIDSMNKRTDNDTVEVGAADQVADPDLERSRSLSEQYAKYPGPIAAFLIFSNEEEQTDMNKHHEYSHNGLHQLGEALRFIANDKGSGEVNQKLDFIRQESEKLMQEPNSNLHAAIMRNCFVMVSEVMATLQQKHFPDAKASVDNVSQSAQEMDSNKPVLDQQSRVKSFFSKAGDAVEIMGRDMQHEPQPQ